MTRTHVNSCGQTVTWCIGCQKIIAYESWPEHASHHERQHPRPFTPKETAALHAMAMAARRAYGKAIIDHTTIDHHARPSRTSETRAHGTTIHDAITAAKHHPEQKVTSETQPEDQPSAPQTGRKSRRAEEEQSRRNLLTAGAAAEIALLAAGLIAGWMLTVVLAASWAALFLTGALWHQLRLARENRRPEWMKVARMELDIYGRIFHDPITGKPNYL